MMRGGFNQMLVKLCFCMALQEEGRGFDQMVLELCFCML